MNEAAFVHSNETKLECYFPSGILCIQIRGEIAIVHIKLKMASTTLASKNEAKLEAY